MRSNTLLSSLSKGVREDPLAEKVLLTESRIAGHTLLRRLALSGTPWANVRPKTPLTLAQSMVADELAVSGRTFADATMTMLLVAELTSSVPEAVAYFASVGDRPGVLRAVFRTLMELRLHGVQVESLRPGAFLDPRKGRALAALLESYEQALAKRGWADEADVLRLAIDRMGEGRASQPLCLVPAGLTLRGLPRLLLEALPSDRVYLLEEDEMEGVPAPPSRLTFAATVPCDEGVDAGPAADLFHQGATAATGIDLFSATGPAAEVREVLRRMVAAGTAFEDVEILLARETPYLRVIRDVAARLGIPCTFGPGLPVVWTRPGRAALAFLSWVRDGFPVRPLADTLAAGDLSPVSGPDGEGLSGPAAARILRRTGIGWGRDRYVPALQAELARLDHRERECAREGEAPAWVAAERRNVAQVLDLVSGLLALTPEPDGEGRVGLAGLCRGLAGILETYCRPASPQETEALAALTERMRVAGRWAVGSFPAPEAAERATALLDGLRVAISGPQPGHLHVAGATVGSGSGRPHTFVVGLDESSFSGVAAADPLLLDEERAELGLSLPGSAELAAEALYRFGRVLASVRGSICFSYSLREPGADRPAFPSPILLQAFRLNTGRPGAGYAELAASLGEPAGCFPRSGRIAFDRDEAWLGRIASGGILARARDAVRCAFPNLERGEELLRARASTSVTPYDGRIDPDPDRLDPRRNPGLVVSPSALEALGGCPLKYFFGHVLGIRPPLDLVRDSGQWLDPMARGSLLHDVFRRFYERLGGRVTGAVREEELLREVCEQTLADYRREIPPPSGAVFERERREMKASAALFLEMERRDAGRGTPRFFEVGFGQGPGSVPAGAPGLEAPVSIPVAGGAVIRLRGRIDRVDEVGDHAYHVWDYKTGRSYGDGGTFVRGRRLQHALYELAAEQVLRASGVDPEAEVVRSGYLFPTERGEGRRWLPESEARAALPGILRSLLDLVAGGVFVAAEDGKYCPWCEYIAACDGEEAAAATRRKLESGDPCLDPLRGVKDLA